MKKSGIILGVILFFISAAAKAQESKISFSLRGGLNISSVTGDDNPNEYFEKTSKKGFSAGFSFGFKANAHLLLLAECVYDQKGYNQKIFLNDNAGNTIGDANSYTNLNYVSVPIIANIVFGTKHSIEFGFGVCNNILIDASTDNPISYSGMFPGSIDVKRNYELYELSAVARLAGAITLAPSILLILEGRYQAGFLNINRGFSGNFAEKNNVAYFGTGLRIHFTKKKK
ncbi:MAG TPA: outer membrane beta-barrel protein [Bacteroidia bacterium]|nr:outer membrane beta-barrel protein [Bacteroidia bacterium]